MAEVVRTVEQAVVVKKADVSGFDAQFIMSASSPDRVKDTIDPKAYPKAIQGVSKLIALWQHNTDFPIGYWANMSAKATQLNGYIKLASTGMAQFVKQLLDDEVPVGASISFRGRGELNDIGGIHYKEISLLECSIVSVPAHPRAVQIAKSFGITLPSSGGELSVPVMSDREYKARMKALNAQVTARRLLKSTR